MAQIAVGHVGFPSQRIGRMSSWAEQKKEHPLEKGMQRKSRKKEGGSGR